MNKIKFLRRNTGEYSRLGKKRKKLQKWRKPRGRDNKMRLRRKGYPRTVEVGYKQDAKTRGLVNGKEQVIVRNLSELEKVEKEQAVLIGKIGMKKRKEIVERAKEKGIKIINEKKLKEAEESSETDKKPKVAEEKNKAEDKK